MVGFPESPVPIYVLPSAPSTHFAFASTIVGGAKSTFIVSLKVDTLPNLSSIDTDILKFPVFPFIPYFSSAIDIDPVLILPSPADIFGTFTPFTFTFMLYSLIGKPLFIGNDLMKV